MPDVHEVEEARGVGTEDLELAERRAIEEPDALAHGARLALCGRLEALPGMRIGRRGGSSRRRSQRAHRARRARRAPAGA